LARAPLSRTRVYGYRRPHLSVAAGGSLPWWEAGRLSEDTLHQGLLKARGE